MAETWRVVLASGEVREVDVIPQDGGRWAASGRHLRGAGFGGSREEAIARWLTMNGDVREILAPGELTRAEAIAAARREGAEAMREAILAALHQSLSGDQLRAIRAVEIDGGAR